MYEVTIKATAFFYFLFFCLHHLDAQSFLHSMLKRDLFPNKINLCFGLQLFEHISISPVLGSLPHSINLQVCASYTGISQTTTCTSIFCLKINILKEIKRLKFLKYLFTYLLSLFLFFVLIQSFLVSFFLPDNFSLPLVVVHIC